MRKMNKLGKKKEDCHDNIFPEIHFKVYAPLQKILVSTISIRIYVKLENWNRKVNGSLDAFMWFRRFDNFVDFFTLLHIFFFTFENAIQ